MIAVKLFTDRRLWYKNHENKIVRQRIHLWDSTGTFLNKKRGDLPARSGLDLMRQKNQAASNVNSARMVTPVTICNAHGYGSRGVLETTAGSGLAPYNLYTEAQFYVMVDVSASHQPSCGEHIFRKKTNHRGHIICRSYVCFLSVLLRNLAQRLNDENFNVYENDQSDDDHRPSSFSRDELEWQVITDKTTVSEAFLRNNFYLLLTPKKNRSTTLTGRQSIGGAINSTDVNTIVDLRDWTRTCIDIRDDQEIHFRPLEIYVPLDIVFAGENGFDRLSIVVATVSQATSSTVKVEKTPHGMVLYAKFSAFNLNNAIIDDINNNLQQICQRLALPNWYDYDLCFGRRELDEESHSIVNCDNSHLRWHSGMQTALIRIVKNRPLSAGEWCWIRSETRMAGHFGNIDFFYWNLLFLRKRLCLYNNPLNSIKSKLNTFIETRSPHDLCGTLLDLCFDCWNFTHNLGEIVFLLSQQNKKLNKSKKINDDKSALLRRLNRIINSQTEKVVDKVTVNRVSDYLHHVVKRLLLHINESFVSANGHKEATCIRLQSVFNDSDKKESLYGSTLSRLAAQCWASMRCSVRMIEIIKDYSHQTLRDNLTDIDFSRGLIQAISQQISANKLLFFSGLSSFNLSCLLLINRQLHLVILLQNGERLLACPIDRSHECLSDNVCARLYLKSVNAKLTKDAPPANLFVSALDQTRQRLTINKPIVEKVFKQPVAIKSVFRKKNLAKLFATSKVEYIVIETNQNGNIGHCSRDSFIKRIQIIDELSATPSLALTLEDPDGCCDSRSQLEQLLDDLELVNLRRQLNYKFEEEWYREPKSKKMIFDDLKALTTTSSPLISGQESQKRCRPIPAGASTASSELTKAATNRCLAGADEGITSGLAEMRDKIRGSRLDRIKIASSKRLLDYFENLYSTLTYIVKLVDINQNSVEEHDNPTSTSPNGDSHRCRLQRIYYYLMQNHDKICCQKVILQNTIKLLDAIASMSMQLVSQGKYDTHEKIRQLLIGVVKTGNME